MEGNTPCSSERAQCFRGTIAYLWFVAWITLLPWRWSQKVPPKRRTPSKLNGETTLRIILFPNIKTRELVFLFHKYQLLGTKTKWRNIKAYGEVILLWILNWIWMRRLWLLIVLMCWFRIPVSWKFSVITETLPYHLSPEQCRLIVDFT
jgi:hypothetical protein